MDRSGWIGYLSGLEDGTDALIGLKLPRNTKNHESASVEGVDVLGRTEPRATHANHCVPVDVDESEDDEGDDVSHCHMSPEPDTADIADCEQEEDILGRILGYLGIVVDVDGNKDTTAENGDGSEHPADHSKESEVCDGVWADLLEKLWLFGV